MRISILVLALLISLPSLKAQNDFDQLFISFGEICLSTENRVLRELKKGPLEEFTGDSLIRLYEKNCGPTEASMRTRILHDIKFKAKLDSVLPLWVWRSHFGYLAGDEYLIPLLDDHLQWSQEEAQRILENKTLPKYERTVVQLLASSSIQSSYESLKQKDLYEDPHYDSLRATLLQKAHANGFNAITISYNYHLLGGDLQTELGALHGISFGFEFPVRKNLRWGLLFGVSASEQKAYLRFDDQGFITSSDLEAFYQFESFVNYEFASLRLSGFSVLGGLGLGYFATDLSYYDPEIDGEVAVGLSTIYPIVGLDYHREFYGTRTIGLRSCFKLTDFGNNDQLRSPLSGYMLQNSLYFRF